MSQENDAVTQKKTRPAPEPLIIGDFDAGSEIAQKLIPQYHPHLASANIIYLCRNKAPQPGGKKQSGSVKKASPLERHVSRRYFQDGQEADFIVMVSLDVWNDLQPTQRTALIDHLLTQCHGEEDEKSGEMKYSKRAPQVQEFPEVAERHGRWNPDLEELGDCLAT